MWRLSSSSHEFRMGEGWATLARLPTLLPCIRTSSATNCSGLYGNETARTNEKISQQIWRLLSNVHRCYWSCLRSTGTEQNIKMTFLLRSKYSLPRQLGSGHNSTTTHGRSEVILIELVTSLRGPSSCLLHDIQLHGELPPYFNLDILQ